MEFVASTIRSARHTNEVVSRLKQPLPEFVHKWTGESRRYVIAELQLPQILQVRGLKPSVDSVALGVGGTRSPTVETFCLVSRVIRLAAKSRLTIISGGVPGVDLAAHLAAIDCAGGRTWAVMANPVDHGLAGHEWSNTALERRIISHGCFISEYTINVDVGTAEFRERLLQRDRIISGLSDIFVAFECSESSATVDTVLRARSQGKAVFGIRSAGLTSRTGLDVLASHNVEILDASFMTDKAIVNYLQTMLNSRC